MTFPWGNYQTFAYADLSLTLTTENYNFRPGLGSNYLERYGYDRYLDPDRAVEMSYGPLDSSFYAGSKSAGYLFFWQLQNLTELEFYTMKAIADRSLADRLPVRLLDGLLALEEVSPRSRAKVGTVTGAPAVSGMNFFYPIFDVVLQYGTERSGWQSGRYDLALQGKEYNPYSPVPVGEDLP